jgi:hypothetical protein
MKALVVYESMFGNTRHIAEAIAAGLCSSIQTEVKLARDAGDEDLEGVGLVVVGGPTHAWGLSGTRSREGAVADAAKHPDHLLDTQPLGPGVREWLHGLATHHGCFAAAFDTRFDKPKAVTGCAARKIQRRLHRSGFTTLAEPHSFVVTGMAGPLVLGEVERAEQWGQALGRGFAKMTASGTKPAKIAV